MDNPKQVRAGQDQESLQDKLARLEAELAIEKSARASAEDSAARQLAQVQSNALQMSAIREVDAGTIEREVIGPDGEPKTTRVAVLEPDGSQRLDEHNRKMWESVPITETVPVYWYKIEIPPSAGLFISVNGQQLYHGETYKFTLDNLRTVKEMVFRAWQHEANVSGSNENAYRPRQSARV